MAVPSLDQFLAALKAQESGGNYKEPPNSVGASGAYQFVPGTWGGYGGYAEAYLAPPAVQDARARQLASQYYARFGNWESVAKAWYAGSGFASKNQTATQKGGPSIATYASEVMARMGGSTATTAAVGTAVVAATRPTDKAGILALQQTMKAAGFDPGPLDGLWGPRTQAAYDKYLASGKAPTAAAAGSPFPNLAGLSNDDKITAVMFTEQGQAVAPFLNDPEIRTIFLRYINGEIDENTLSGLVSQSHVYQVTNKTQRQWDALQNTDPATASNALNQTKAGLQRMADTMGYTLTEDQLNALALAVKRDGYTEDQAKIWIITTRALSGGGQAGEALATVNNLLTSWMVDMSDASRREWVAALMAGTQTEDTFHEFVRQVAMSKFPTMAAALKANPNLTPDQFVDPYRQQAVKMLGINGADVNFTDPKWAKALQTWDDKTGTMRAMNLDEWGREIRSDPQFGWKYTTGAKDQAAAMIMQIGESMGQVRF